MQNTFLEEEPCMHHHRRCQQITIMHNRILRLDGDIINAQKHINNMLLYNKQKSCMKQAQKLYYLILDVVKLAQNKYCDAVNSSNRDLLDKELNIAKVHLYFNKKIYALYYELYSEIKH